MWGFIKHKLSKLGCLVAIGISMAVVTSISRSILGWLNYDEAARAALAGQIGDYFGKGVFGLAVLAGFVLMGLQLKAELKAKNVNRPPKPPPIPQLPETPRAILPGELFDPGASPKARKR